MKHTLNVTFLLLGLFLMSQVVGLGTINKYIKTGVDEEGKLIILHADTAIGEQPEVEEKTYSFIPIIIAILAGTALLLVLIKFELRRFWKFWFFLSVFITMAVAFGVYVPILYAWIIALVLALLKILKPNPIIHNFTEMFVYTGITIIILPFLNLVSALVLLGAISVYDMIAVWKSKHMIKLAKFQTKNKMFAGLMLDYGKNVPDYDTKAKKVPVKGGRRTAILGGGDIAFPMMFSAAVMEHLILVYNVEKLMALMQTLIIPFFVGIALFILFVKGEKGKFYPAMPFLSIGCVIGLLVILGLNLL